MELSTLKRNPENKNTHPPAQLRLLGKIILTRGWRNSIVVSLRSGFITKGHGRLDAALAAGLTHGPVDFQKYASAAEEREDMIADNKIAELAEMDEKGLAALLREMAAEDGFDSELAGFDESGFAELMKSFFGGPGFARQRFGRQSPVRARWN